LSAGLPNTVITEHKQEGLHKRQKGLQPCHFMSTALDPRTRDFFGIPVEEHNMLKTGVHTMLLQFHQKKGTVVSKVVPKMPDIKKGDGSGQYLQELRAKRLKMEKTAVNVSSSPVATSNECESESSVLSRHLQIELFSFFNEPISSVDCSLLWWKHNQHRFPLLAEAARHWLCVPATSAPVERLFSIAGRVIEERRSRLDPSIVDDIVFLHESLSTIKLLDPNNKLS
jgi:hypothetical protein